MKLFYGGSPALTPTDPPMQCVIAQMALNFTVTPIEVTYYVQVNVLGGVATYEYTTLNPVPTSLYFEYPDATPSVGGNLNI